MSRVRSGNVAGDFGRAHAAGAESFRSEPAHGSDSGQNVGDTERIVSVAAGLGLGLVGLCRKGIRGLPLVATGAALVWRGYTGRCQCYAALGIDTAHRGPATAVPAGQGCKIEKSIVVDRSPAELYKF